MSRILLIDDDDALRKMLRLTLTGMGHSVVEARNGREGVALDATQQPDLVLTDIIMPDKEGIETILEIRRQHPETRIIAMSGGGRVNARDYLVMARRFGARYVLEKPFSNGEMALAIESALA